MLDNMGRVIEEGPDPRPILPGQKRTYRVWLDCNQYRADLDNVAAGKMVIYTFYSNKQIFIKISCRSTRYYTEYETLKIFNGYRLIRLTYNLKYFLYNIEQNPFKKILISLVSMNTMCILTIVIDIYTII